MRRLSAVKFDRFVRVLVSFAILFSTIGTAMPLAVAQARPASDPPSGMVGKATPVPPEATPVVETTPTLEPIPTVVETDTATLIPTEVTPVVDVTSTLEPTPTVVETATAIPITPEPTVPADVSITPDTSLGGALAQPLTVTQKVLDRFGGRLISDDKRVQLDVPPGLFKQSARVSITSRRIVSETETHDPRIEFDLDALDVKTQARLAKFEQPLTLTVNLKGLIDLDQVPSDMYVALYSLNADGNPVPVWPIQVDRQTGTISAQVDHFSSWGAGLYPGTPGVWEFHYTPPEVALYNGAATAQIPLNVPAGRSGLQPNLGLSYNSATLNGLSGAEKNSLDWTRGGEVGGFWQLDGVPKIAREKWENCWWGDRDDPKEGSCIRDVFTLIINSTGYDLEPGTPSGGQDALVTIPTRYYAVGAPNLYIERHTACTQYDTKDGECTLIGGNGSSPNNETKEYWIVRMADGTQYRLGYNADSEQVADDVCNPHWWYGEKCKKIGSSGDYMSGLYGMGYKGEQRPPRNDDQTPYRVARAWWADQVTDKFGNTMTFSDGTFWFNYGERVTPRTIQYNNSGANYLTRIALVGTDTNPPNNEPTIDGVEMYTKDSGGVERLVRRYQFARAWFNHNKWDGSHYIRSDFQVLSSVQEQTVDASGAWYSLPAQTFTYEWRSTRDAYDIMQLIQVNNGYGGVTTFDYIDDMRPYGGYCDWAGCNDHIVSSKRVSGGAGTPDLYSTYDYAQVCFDSYNNGQASACASRATQLCGNKCDKDRFIKLGGFGEVTETQWNGPTPVARSKHSFINANPSWFLGHEYKVQQLDPANNNAVLTLDETQWSDKLNNAWFGFVSEKTSTTYSDGLALSTRTSYAVDSYANVVSEYQYGAEVRLPNAGFEQGIASWVNTNPQALYTVTDADQFAGRYSLRLQGGAGTIYQALTGLTPNTTYTVRLWIKASPDNGDQFQLFLHDDIGQNYFVSSPLLPTTTWTQVQLNYQANARGTLLIELAHLDNSSANGVTYIDEVAVARAADVGDERSIQRFYRNLTDNSRWLIGLKWDENTFATITPNVADYALLKLKSCGITTIIPTTSIAGMSPTRLIGVW